jgi:hypothetical protein
MCFRSDVGCGFGSSSLKSYHKVSFPHYVSGLSCILIERLGASEHWMELGMVVHAFNPSTWEAEAEGGRRRQERLVNF